MLLLRGTNSLYPCPVCLVPWDQLSLITRDWPQRTVTEARKAVETAKFIGEQDEATKKLGIRPIKVSISYLF